LGNKNYSFAKLALTHRQYFTLYPERVNLAYRLSYQPKIAGDMPFYMLPFVFNSRRTRDGLGGAKTLRGILRNRIAGEDYLFGNIELRWKMIKTVIANQNVYLALSTFLDGGLVTGRYDVPEQSTLISQIHDAGSVDQDGAEQIYKQHFTTEKERPHWSYGIGVHLALNENFVLAMDYGLAHYSPQDGYNGLYMGMDFLF